MHPVSDLQKLADTLVFRIRRLEALARQIAEKDNADCAAQMTYLTVESLVSWANFCRSFYLSCTVCSARQIGGGRVSHTRSVITDQRSALVEAIRELKPNALSQVRARRNINSRFEPTWHEKRSLVALSGNLAFPNNATIVAAFSYPTRFMDDLPIIRNFFAHRSQGTARKVEALASRDHGLATLHHPADLVNKTLTGHTEPLLIEWLIDIRAIGLALCQ